MKRFFSMLAIIGIIAVSNCTQVPENNDPVLGTWIRAELNDDAAKTENSQIREEWIFNDVYLGRYHRYSDKDIAFYTDFSWEVIDGVYTISYSKGDMEEVTVSLNHNDNLEALQLQNGSVFAVRK